VSTQDNRSDVAFHGKADFFGPTNLPPGTTFNSPTINTPTVNGGTFNSPTLVTPSADVIVLPEQGGDPAALADTAKIYSKDVAGVTQFFVRASDGTITQLTPAASSTPAAQLGSGIDGALNFDGVSNVTLAADGAVLVPAAGVYTLTRDVYASSVIVSGGGAVIASVGFRIFSTGSAQLENSPSVRCNGGTGGNGAAGVGGAAGARSIAVSAVYGQSGVGGAGGSAAPGSNGALTSVAIIGYPAANAAAGTNGGRYQGGGGGSGASGAGGVGPGSAVTLAQSPGYHTIESAIQGRDLNQGRICAGSGGGGGAGSGAGGGGGGGGPGGVVFIAAQTITGAGSIEAAGGDGGAGQGGGLNTGGGGGGGGGVVITLTSSSYPLSVAVDVTGGTGGNPSGTGQAGGNGGDGVHFQYRLSS
jgi:hypothetical protein